MFKTIGCLFRAIGCLVILIILLVVVGAGCYYLFRYVASPIPFSQNGKTVKASDAQKITESFRENAIRSITKYDHTRKQGIGVQITEDELAALILVSWNTPGWDLKASKFPGMHAEQVWTDISDTGFDVVIRLEPLEVRWKLKRNFYIKLSEEIYTRDGKLLIRRKTLQTGKLPIPGFVSSMILKNVEEKLISWLNDPSLWKGGHISDLKLFSDSLSVSWSPAIVEAERNQ